MNIDELKIKAEEGLEGFLYNESINMRMLGKSIMKDRLVRYVDEIQKEIDRLSFLIEMDMV